MLTEKHFTRRLMRGTPSLPPGHEGSFGTREQNAARAEAEHGSRDLLRAIRKYHPERAG